MRDTTDSFPPSKKLESPLVGEPGCGSSAGRGGRLLELDELPAFIFRLKYIVIKRRTKSNEI